MMKRSLVTAFASLSLACPVAWYNGFSPSGKWGERYSWHKQELYKGRKWLLGFNGQKNQSP